MPMENKELCKELCDLIQLDIDAVVAYETAIREVDVIGIREQLEAFKQDHERHISQLSAVVHQFGEKAPERKPDFKGFLIQGFTAIRSATGIEGTLKAMKSNEELTNRTYQKALSLDLPHDVMSIVQRNYADEQRHLRAIEGWLHARPWEGPQVGV